MACGPNVDQSRHRRVSTRQPDQPGSTVTVNQRIQRVGAVGRCGGLGPREDGGNIDTLDFERFQLIGHCPHAGWRFSWRSPPEVHPIGRCVDFPGCVPRIDRPNAQPSSRSLRLHGRAWLHPMRTRLDHRRGAPVVAWTKRLPACKARSGCRPPGRMTDGAGHSQLGIVRGWPLKTGRDSWEWHGSGTTDEDNVRATSNAGVSSTVAQGPVTGGRRPRWQASIRRRGSTRLDP
jgi:hypothetical protein